MTEENRVRSCVGDTQKIINEFKLNLQNTKPQSDEKGHIWFKNSGTTDKCSKCSLVRFWLTDEDIPSRQLATHAEYDIKGNFCAAKRHLPDCEVRP